MIRTILIGMTAAALAAPAGAQAPAPPANPDRLQLTPIFDARARFETVNQGALEADALTLRLRAGAEARIGLFSLLAEGEATVATVNDYNAFAFAAASSQRRPQFAVVVDPENAELNRLQLQYRSPRATITLGRQLINLDDQRWVGSVGWRQNEQTFDALRAEARLGPVGVDLTYAIGQRTIFGSDAGPRTSFDGDFFFAGLSSPTGPVQGRLFAYLLDYDEAFFLTNSSQTYGGVLSGSLPIGSNARATLRASYARQSDHGRNPFNYSANYWNLEAGATLGRFTIAAGWERLGSDNGRSVQTPMATLHRFNGWADVFLTTPPAGLDDAYVSITHRFGTVGPLRDLSAQLTWHRFGSAIGSLDYGSEWNASVGFRIGRVRLLVKYADYDANGFGTNTRKFWLQAEWAL